MTEEDEHFNHFFISMHILNDAAINASPNELNKIAPDGRRYATKCTFENSKLFKFIQFMCKTDAFCILSCPCAQDSIFENCWVPLHLNSDNIEWAIFRLLEWMFSKRQTNWYLLINFKWRMFYASWTTKEFAITEKLSPT